MGLFLKQNHLLRCWDCRSLLNYIGAFTLSVLLKLRSRKLELWFVLRSIFLLRLLFISVNLPYSLVWNTVVMSGGVPNCYMGMLDKLQKRVYRTTGPSLAAVLEL